MYVVSDHFEYRRKAPIFLRLIWSLPDIVLYMRVLVKDAKQSLKGRYFFIAVSYQVATWTITLAAL